MVEEMRPTYTVVVKRDGEWWHIRVPELQNVFTQSRRLDQVDHMAREVTALMLDVPEDSFDLQIEMELSADLSERLAETRRLRQEAEAADLRARQAVRELASDLTVERRLTVRDAGSLLNLSHQRVAQLLHGPNRVAGQSEGDNPRMAGGQLAATAAGNRKGKRRYQLKADR